MSWLSSVGGKLKRATQGGLKSLTQKAGKLGGVAGGVVGGIIAGPSGAAFGKKLGEQAVKGLLPKNVTVPNPLRPVPMAPGPTLPALPNMPRKMVAPAGKPGGLILPSSQPQTGLGSAWQWIDQNLAGGWLPGGVLPKGYGPGTNNVTGGGVQAINGQIPMVTDPVNVTAPRAPRGYVLVRMPDGSVKAVLKEVAYALGLRKRPQKRGGVSAREVRIARKVQHFVTGLTVGRHAKTPLRKKSRR